jgi:hypothetical protein
LVKLGKKLKKNNIAVDIVNFGEEAENVEKLESFIKAVNTGDERYFFFYFFFFSLSLPPSFLLCLPPSLLFFFLFLLRPPPSSPCLPLYSPFD